MGQIRKRYGSFIECKSSEPGCVLRSFANGSAVVILTNGTGVLATPDVIGDLYPLATGQSVSVDVAEDGETVLSLVLVK